MVREEGGALKFSEMEDKYSNIDEERSPSRKRPYRDEFEERRGGYHDGRKAEMFPLLKILVPNYAAGAIIGKGGHNISQLQATYGAKIRLSQNNEYYPGCQERVAIITGDVDKVIDLHKYVMDKIRDEGHNQGSTADERQRYSRSSSGDDARGRLVKIIVPNGTAGLLIGKGGGMIRNLIEQSGAKIVISNKDHELVPGERVVTITGSAEENEDACRLIIDKIATDPSNMMNRNLSYGGNQPLHRVEGGNSTGYHSGFGRQHGNFDGGLSALSSVLGNLAGNKSQQQSLLSSIGLSGAGASNFGNSPNILGGNAPFGLAGSSISLLNQAGINPPNLPHIKTKVTVEMHIPDSLVGAILGKGGKTISEFINYSGAKIQFSGKGEYVPGTNDRVLTIEGDFTSSQVAHFLICQKIVQAEVDSSK